MNAACVDVQGRDGRRQGRSYSVALHLLVPFSPRSSTRPVSHRCRRPTRSVLYHASLLYYRIIWQGRPAV